MARKTVSVALDGESYQLTQLPSTEGLGIYSKLLRLLGPMIRSALSDPAVTGGAKASVAAEDPEKLQLSDSAGLKIASIIIQGFETLDTTFLLELAQSFSKVTMVKLEGSGFVEMSAGDIFDQHFAGRYAHLTRWLLAHLKLNYSDFLAGLASSVKQSPAA